MAFIDVSPSRALVLTGRYVEPEAVKGPPAAIEGPPAAIEAPPAAIEAPPAAIEALKLLYEFAFEHLGLHGLYGIVVADNAQMRGGTCPGGRRRRAACGCISSWPAGPGNPSAWAYGAAR